MNKQKFNNNTQQAFAQINKLVHEPSRLLILANLYVIDSADYVYLTRQTGLTWGNLSSHLNKLEVAGYVAIQKEFKGKKPYTFVSITDTGIQALSAYRQQMKQFLDPLPGLE